MIEIALYFDGLCDPINPGGVAAYGWLYRLLDAEGLEGRTLLSGYGIGCIGDGATNNVAEWQAVINGLAECKVAASRAGLRIGEYNLVVRGDSQLVCRQLAGKWKVHAENLRPLYERARKLLPPDSVVRWIPREENEAADALSRKAYEVWRRANPEEAARLDAVAVRRPR